MASDYEGEPSEFALVIPVPSFIKKDQISVVDTKTIDHLDAYTAPRLVEYFDADPCERDRLMALAMAPQPTPTAAMQPAAPEISRRQGRGAIRHRRIRRLDPVGGGQRRLDPLADRQRLQDSGRREPVIGSYIKQKMHFFIAKVNLKRHAGQRARLSAAASGALRDGEIHAAAAAGHRQRRRPQDLVIYALTPHGRIEATNYRTVKVPSDVDVPLFVKNDFANFYKATFEHAVARENMHGVFGRIRLGYGLVRSVCRRADEQGPSSRSLARAMG